MSTMADVLARALYVAAHWQDTITEHDSDLKPKAEYERRAAERWDAGNAGWSNYQRYPRYAEAGAAALSAAGFGPLTLVQIAARDRPEQMEAARAKVREERKASLRQRLREARAQALEDAAEEIAWKRPDGPCLTFAACHRAARWLRARAAAERGGDAAT